MSLLNLSGDFLKKIQVVDWGYTEASAPITYGHYETWTKSGLAGGLQYLTDHRKDLRKDLKEVFPEFSSALVFLFEYASEKKRLQKIDPPIKIASYVTGFDGMDYHHWIREKLDRISLKLSEEISGLKTFYSIDAQPVLERDLAYRAGLGWFGKNSMLISKKHGSYFIIGTLLLNQKLPLPTKLSVEPDHCGNCTACIEHCPTDAIVANKVVDASKCISTYTIEMFKEAEAPKGYPSKSNEVFGCDICQEVCPWNNKPLKRVKAGEEVDWVKFFERNPELILSDLEDMSNRQYRKKFKGTPLERTGRVGMIKNLNKLKS